MKRATRDTVILASGAAVALLVGALVTFAPAVLDAAPGSALPADPSSMSELRSPGGAILLAAFYLTAAIWVRALRPSALVVGALFYGGYTAARGFSLVVDGTPNSALLGALAVEVILAAAFVWTLARPASYVTTSQEPSSRVARV